MKSFFTYLKSVRAELEHVVWPTPKTTVGHTILIIILSVVTALLIAALDYLFTQGVATLIR